MNSLDGARASAAFESATTYPRYPTYKDSDIPWLGTIPAHWHDDLVKRRFVVELGKMLNSSVKTRDGVAKPYLRAANIHWGQLVLDDVNKMEFTKDQLARYRLVAGDLLVTEGGVTVGRSAIWRSELDECYYQNSINRVRPRSDHEASPEFLYYWIYFMKSNGFIDLVADKATFGHLTQEKLQALSTVTPPLPEQRAIAAFLDAETARIDAAIEAQQRLIALLQEKRQALISHAVTKGLNPDAPMRDSGIEWLGEIPGHWAVVALKRLAKIQSGVAKGRDLSGRDVFEVPYLRVANVQDGYIDLSDVATIPITKSELPRYLLRAGDVLMNEGGDNDKLGRGHVWSGEIDPCIHQNHVFAVRPFSVDSYWLTQITSSDYAKFYFYSRSKQSTNLASISATNLQELPVVVPSRAEQLTILDYLDGETARIKDVLAVADLTIGLLQERRSALITAAVAGQIDVRGQVDVESSL